MLEANKCEGRSSEAYLHVEVEVLGQEAWAALAEIALWDVVGGLDLASQHATANWGVSIIH